MRLLEHIFKTIAPATCFRCGSEGSLLCRWCREAALPGLEERCYRCQRLSPYGKTCKSCRSSTAINHLFVRTEYTDSARLLVHKMKFSYAREAALLMADEMSSIIPIIHPNTLILHIPTITSHVRQRGFDHAKVLALHIARSKGLQYLPALARTGQARQVGSSKSARSLQTRDAFRLKQTYSVVDCSVMLVDDVYTTGATMESAARVLKDAGASRIDAAVFARAK